MIAFFLLFLTAFVLFAATVVGMLAMISMELTLIRELLEPEDKGFAAFYDMDES